MLGSLGSVRPSLPPTSAASSVPRRPRAAATTREPKQAVNSRATAEAARSRLGTRPRAWHVARRHGARRVPRANAPSRVRAAPLGQIISPSQSGIASSSAPKIVLEGGELLTANSKRRRHAHDHLRKPPRTRRERRAGGGSNAAPARPRGLSLSRWLVQVLSLSVRVVAAAACGHDADQLVHVENVAPPARAGLLHANEDGLSSSMPARCCSRGDAACRGP